MNFLSLFFFAAAHLFTLLLHPHFLHTPSSLSNVRLSYSECLLAQDASSKAESFQMGMNGTRRLHPTEKSTVSAVTVKMEASSSAEQDALNYPASRQLSLTENVVLGVHKILSVTSLHL